MTLHIQVKKSAGNADKKEQYNNNLILNNKTKSKVMELKKFRKLNDGRILLDGLVWDIHPDKAIEVKNPDTGFKIHSVKYENVYYYPVAVDKSTGKKYMAQFMMKDGTSKLSFREIN
jgi:hypothetical protein